MSKEKWYSQFGKDRDEASGKYTSEEKRLAEEQKIARNMAELMEAIALQAEYEQLKQSYDKAYEFEKEGKLTDEIAQKYNIEKKYKPYILFQKTMFLKGLDDHADNYQNEYLGNDWGKEKERKEKIASAIKGNIITEKEKIDNLVKDMEQS